MNNREQVLSLMRNLSQYRTQLLEAKKVMDDLLDEVRMTEGYQAAAFTYSRALTNQKHTEQLVREFAKENVDELKAAPVAGLGFRKTKSVIFGEDEDAILLWAKMKVPELLMVDKGGLSQIVKTGIYDVPENVAKLETEYTPTIARDLSDLYPATEGYTKKGTE